MSEILEVMILICFGFSWPISVIKSYKARSAKGKSIFFLLAIIIGYICGISSKFLNGNINYVLIFYFFNLVVVSVDLAIYFRNRHLDKINAEEISGSAALNRAKNSI